MFSTFPSTPRSRFSKALPVVPGQSTTEIKASNTNLAMSVKSNLPALPHDAMAPQKTIPRRPIGAQNKLTKPPSICSLSSVYSDSPGLSRSQSNSSTKDSLSADSEDQLPSSPLKDKEETQTTNILDSPSSFTSPTQPELWKRRSIRSEKNLIQVSELKLKVSNGSTFSSPPRGRQEQTTDRPLPRSITGRKPVPARPAPPQPEFMGNKLAKLEGKLENKVKKKDSKDTSFQDEAPAQQPSSFKQLPTPEYLKADKQQPITPQVISPLSPYTPPDEAAPQLPPKAEARSKPNASTTMSDIEVPNLLTSHSRESSDTLTITSEPKVMRSPQPKKAFPARILTPQLSPDKEKTSPLALGSPAAHSSFFPTVHTPFGPGTIVPGPPLELIHYDCYQSHRFMRNSKNAYCPVGCMICLKKDTEPRWRCTWCCLSACGSCMQVLSSAPGKDLRACLERIGRKP